VIPGLSIEQALISFGYFGLFLIVFAESGLFFGFFLPGDSLLITAGVLAAAHPEVFSLPLVCAVAFIAAVLGDAVGYWFGRRVGSRLYDRPDSRLFKRSHLEAAEAFYHRHGGKTIVIARFLPFVRTFAPIVAGTAGMPYRRFAMFNVVGGFIWAVGLPVAGYLLGKAIPPETLDKYLLFILAGVVALSLLPTLIHLYRHNRAEVHARVRSLGRQGAVRPVTPPEGPSHP
jgi:membrane-associated protein